MKKLLLIIILLWSCTSSREVVLDVNCLEDRVYGNLDINTPFDDITPYLFNNKLQYITEVRDSINRFEYSSVIIENGDIIEFGEVKKLKFKDLSDISNPTYFYDTQSDKTELYFSASESKDRKKNINIFYSYKYANDNWSEPIGIDTDINTEYYESNPYISSNGKVLLFVSDRVNGIGGLDIYISLRNLDGSWQMPENMGDEINTIYDEKFPSLSDNLDLYFSSNGYSEGDNYDILKSLYDGADWNNAELMLFPINTQYDELGQSVNKKNIFLSSNRPGGCGNFDIYQFDLCGPIKLTGEIIYESIPVSLSGVVNLRNTYGELVEQQRVTELGIFNFILEADNYYSIEYKNDCISDFEGSFDFYSPCSDSSSVLIKSKFIIPDQKMNFSYENYKLPFFVTGYYIPNTKENLSKLRRQFHYNILGHSDSTKYIEYPDSTYDIQAVEIDKILSETKQFLLSNAKDLADLCFETNSKIHIKIIGYSDPRPMSKKSSYIGPDIKEKKYNLNIKNGRPLDNILLSKLRAYYTAKELELYLINDDDYSLFKDYIIWDIEGKGVDDDENIINADKRRVDISINISEN